MLVLCAIAMLGSVRNLQATTTYRYSGSSSVLWTTNSTKNFTIARVGSGALTVHGALTGSSKFRLYNTSVYLPDSAHDSLGVYDTVRQFVVAFSSSIADTTYATLILHDSSRADTISLIGFGTADTNDFEASPSNNISLYPPTTSYGWEYITNHHSTSFTEYAAISGDSGFTIHGHGSSVTINQYGYGTDSLRIDYHAYHSGAANGYLHIWTDSGHRTSTYIYLYGYDSTGGGGGGTTLTAPVITGPALGVVQFGDTACGTVIIRNPNSVPMRITHIVDSAAYDNNWSATGMHSTPFTLAAHDSTTYTLCWTPPHNNWFDSYVSIFASYSDSAGRSSGSAHSYASAHGPSCYTPYPDSIAQMSDVMAGGYIEGVSGFIMHIDSTMVIADVQMDSGAVTILSPSFPRTVHNGDTVMVHFRVTPSAANPPHGTYRGFAEFATGNCYQEFYIRGQVVTNSSDSLGLFADQTELLTLRSDTTSITRTFRFINNSGGREFVTSASLSTGAHFHITGYDPHSPWDTLANGASMGITIQFDADTNGFYRDSLTINTQGGLKGQVFNLEAIRSQGVSAGVQQIALVSPASLSIVPNPATGPVVIALSNTRRSTLEIFDLLGARIAIVPDAPSYIWQPGNLPAGSYIIRASGVDANGAQFVISKSLILQ